MSVSKECAQTTQEEKNCTGEHKEVVATTFVFENAHTGSISRFVKPLQDSREKALEVDKFIQNLGYTGFELTLENEHHTLGTPFHGMLYSGDVTIKVRKSSEREACKNIEDLDPLLCELKALETDLQRKHGDMFTKDGGVGNAAEESILQLKYINKQKQKGGLCSLKEYCCQLAVFLASLPTSSTQSHQPIPTLTFESLNRFKKGFADTLETCVSELISVCKHADGSMTSAAPMIPRFPITGTFGEFPEYALRRNGASAITSMQEPLVSTLPLLLDKEEPAMLQTDPKDIIEHLRSAHSLLTLIEQISQYRRHCAMAHYLICHHTWLEAKRQHIATDQKLVHMPSQSTSLFTVGTWNMAHINLKADMQRVCPGRVDVFRHELIHRLGSMSDQCSCAAVCIQECSSMSTLEALVCDTPYKILASNKCSDLPIIYNATQWECISSQCSDAKECGLKHGIHIVRLRHLSDPSTCVLQDITLVNAHLTPGSRASNAKEIKILQDFMVIESGPTSSNAVIGLMDANVCSSSYDHRDYWFTKKTLCENFARVFETHNDPNCGTSLSDGTCSSACQKEVPRLYDIVVSNKGSGLEVKDLKIGFCVQENKLSYECKRKSSLVAKQAFYEFLAAGLPLVSVEKLVFGDHQPVFATISLGSPICK